MPDSSAAISSYSESTKDSELVGHMSPSMVGKAKLALPKINEVKQKRGADETIRKVSIVKLKKKKFPSSMRISEDPHINVTKVKKNSASKVSMSLDLSPYHQKTPLI